MPHSSPFFLFFFFNDTATTEIYTLSLHDALPISTSQGRNRTRVCDSSDRRREQGGDQPCIGDDCDASQFGKISLDARLDAVAPDAEQPRLALETGLEQAVACLETED